MSTFAEAPTTDLLDDSEVANFIVNGYHLLQLNLSDHVNKNIAKTLDEMLENPGDAIMDVVPELNQVIEHPLVRGALISLAGHDYELYFHRHWHVKEPGSSSMPWHQDGKNRRGPKMDRFLGLYYPTDVSADMGPTMVVPGTHFRDAPSDRMKTYSNIRGQVPMVVKAGTFAITHFDLWHGTAANRSSRRRHMIKFTFNRTRPNMQATWNHDPEVMDRALDWHLQSESGHPKDLLKFFNPLNVGQTDKAKEVVKRLEAWHALTGSAPA